MYEKFPGLNSGCCLPCSYASVLYFCFNYFSNIRPHLCYSMTIISPIPVHCPLSNNNSIALKAERVVVGNFVTSEYTSCVVSPLSAALRKLALKFFSLFSLERTHEISGLVICHFVCFFVCLFTSQFKRT